MKQLTENINSRELEIAKQHNLHNSWLTPASRGENCPCCKKLRDFSHYITDAGVCVFCSVACKDKKICQVSTEEFIELFYNYKKYLVKKSDIGNKHNGVIMLPDGTAFDLTQMYIDTTDKHGNKLECPRFRGSNSDYEIWGQLPIVSVIRAVVESDSTKLDGPICPACYSSNIEYLCNHWACHDCQWKGRVFEYRPEPPKGINPNENISCDIGDDD